MGDDFKKAEITAIVGLILYVVKKEYDYHYEDRKEKRREKKEKEKQKQREYDVN